MLKNGQGRPRIVEEYKSAHEYLNKYVLIVKDMLIKFKEIENIKRKEYDKAKAKSSLQMQKLEKAYEGFEYYREK